MSEPREILDSWKEIADYLRKDARTCQRYGREMGLPIHRLDGSPRARVFAYKHEIDAWRAKTVDEHEHKRKRLRLALLAGAAVVGVIAAILVWHPWIPREPSFILPSDRPSVAILNLANRTGQKDLDKFREVLPSMISYDLSQSRYLYVVPDDQVASILARLNLLEKETYTREDLRAIGRRGVVKYAASGFYSKAEERCLVSLKVQEAETGKLVGAAEVQAESIDGIFAHGIDELTLKIKPLLELTAVEIANDIDGDLERVTTSSIEAYGHCLQGVKLAGASKPREAIEAFEKAAAIDPEFAMAYRDMAVSHSKLRDPVGYRKNIAKAQELSKQEDRVPLRGKLLNNLKGVGRSGPGRRRVPDNH